MLITPHAAVGVAIATQFDRLWIMVPLAIGSHFILDYIPHWDTDPHNMDRRDKLLFIVDMLGAALIGVIFSINNPNWEHIWIGGLCATLPDSHHIIRVLFGDEKLQRYTRIHERVHANKDLRFWPGIALQAFVIVISIILAKSSF